MIMGYPTNLVLHTTMEHIGTYYDIYEPCTEYGYEHSVHVYCLKQYSCWLLIRRTPIGTLSRIFVST